MVDGTIGLLSNDGVVEDCHFLSSGGGKIARSKDCKRRGWKGRSKFNNPVQDQKSFWHRIRAKKPAGNNTGRKWETPWGGKRADSQ